MAAPAVEAAPAAALLGASILAICAWVALVGLSKGYDYSLGAVLRELATALDFKVWKFNVRLGGAFASLDDRIRDSIAAGIQGLEYTIGRLFHGLEWIVRKNADVLAAFAHDVEVAFGNLTNAEIPQQVVSHTRTIVQRVTNVSHAADVRIRRAEAVIYRGIDDLRRDFARTWQQTLRGIDDLRGILAHDVIPAIRGLDKTVDDVVGYTRKNLARRLTRVERLVLGGAIVGAALATLTRFFPYFRCTNVRNASRALCRMDMGLLQALVDSTLILAGTVSLVEMTRDIQGVMEPSTDALRAFIREF